MIVDISKTKHKYKKYRLLEEKLIEIYDKKNLIHRTLVQIPPGMTIEQWKRFVINCLRNKETVSIRNAIKNGILPNIE